MFDIQMHENVWGDWKGDLISQNEKKTKKARRTIWNLGGIKLLKKGFKKFLVIAKIETTLPKK